MEVKFFQPTFQDMAEKQGSIWARVLINGNTSTASISGSCNNMTQQPDILVPPANNGGLKIYVQSNTTPTVEDPGANLGTLTNTSNPVIGLIGYVRDAEELISVELMPQKVIYAGASIGTLTAISASFKGQAANPGVTALNNIAAAITLTGIDPSSAIGTAQFWLSIRYTRKPYTA